jgi:serine/threonine protein kinase
MNNGRMNNLMKKEFDQPLSLLPLKGRIQASYNHSLFVQAISDCSRLLSDQDTEILLDRRNRVGVVSLPQRDGSKVEIVIKEFRSRGLNRLKSIFLRGKALKSWRGAAALIERRIETPPPVAYLVKRKGLFLDQSFFLAERVSGVEEIRFLFPGLPSSELRRLLISLSQHLSNCHKKGILHRDLSDGNILVKKDKPGEFRFYLIDTNRIRIKKRIGLLSGVKSLVRLGVPLDFQCFFLQHYLGATHVKRFHWFWYRINKSLYTQFVELKKKLRLRQLAQKLKIQ